MQIYLARNVLLWPQRVQQLCLENTKELQLSWKKIPDIAELYTCCWHREALAAKNLKIYSVIQKNKLEKLLEDVGKMVYAVRFLAEKSNLLSQQCDKSQGSSFALCCRPEEPHHYNYNLTTTFEISETA